MADGGSPAAEGRRPAAIRALARDPNYAALWLGQLVSIFGDRFTYLALLAVIVAKARDPGNPAAELALLPLASFLPTIVLGPWVGAVVDRSDTRRVLILSDLCRGAAVLTMIPAVLLGGLAALFALVFWLYVANTFFLPARSAIVPLLVSREILTEANSLATFAGVAATIAGSLVAGFLIDRFGWAWGFAIDAATYFVSVVFLWRIRMPARGTTAAVAAAGLDGAASPPDDAATRYKKLNAEIRDGFRILLQTPRAWWVTIAVMLLWAVGGVLHVAVPILAGAGASGRVASGVGTLLAAVATGMVVGTLALAWRGRSVGSPRLRLAVSLIGMGAAVALFASLPHGTLTFGAAFLAGIFVALLLVTAETALQEAIAPEARGRIFALRDVAARIAVLAAAGVAGAVVARGVPPHAAVTAAAVLLGVTGLLGLFGAGGGGGREPSASVEAGGGNGGAI